MNQNQNASFEVQIKSYEEDACRTPIDAYINRLTCDTNNGKINWRPAYCETGYEHTWGGVVIRLTYEVPELGCEKFTLAIRKAGNARAPFTMVAQHVASTHAPDELRELWKAIQEYINCEDSTLVFKYIDDYMAKSKATAFSDEINSIIEDACRDIIKLVQEQKIEK